MKLRILLLAILALPLALFGATASEIASAIVKDFAARDSHPLKDVTYVVTEDTPEYNYVYRVKRIGVWQTQHTLLMANGYPSYEKQVTNFAKARDNHFEQYPVGGEIKDRWLDLNKLSALIVPGSVAFASSTDNQQVYMSFACKASVAGSEPVDLKGSLVYDKKLECVTSIQFVNEKPFKTQRGRVDDMTETLTFKKDEKLGVPVTTSVRWSVKGRKSFMSDFDDEYNASITDYSK
jgi:hypothetical protein